MTFICFETAIGSIAWLTRWRVQICIMCICATKAVYGQVRYSIPEEMAKGSFVGNIAQDLGLDLKRLKSSRARIFTEDSREYIGLNTDEGTLLVKDRIDREQLCAQISRCTLHFQIILENPMELHRVVVEVLDINDNAPVFPKKEIQFQISEIAVAGTRFLLESAMDPDVGVNTLQSYALQPIDNFILKLQSRPDGSKYLEMVLQTVLDREKQEEHALVLTAVDGGSPQKSGTVKINVAVVDANDNPPVFTQALYKASVLENVLKGTLVLKVSASDVDKGANAEVTYSFIHATDSVSELFDLDSITGEIKVRGQFDFERSKQYEINVEAVDNGGLADSCKVLIEIIDVNDNAPVITLMSFSNPVPENCLPETVIAMLNVKDLDSGKNGQIRCSSDHSLPFRIKSSSANFYNLVTDQVLDRENVAEYNITIIATDEGSPPFSSKMTLTLQISDVNDNAPIFDQQSYSTYIKENNAPGISIFSLKAEDADFGPNAHISYFLDDKSVNGIKVSSYISVNAERGSIHAVRSFDYEHIKQFKIQVKAQDGGSPPLSTNVTVTVFIEDQNDNSPQILYPVQSGVSLVAEMVARSADVGYLVTKVVAVDADSGQNAWLSYKLLKATDRALFEVGSQNGEIRTSRQVSDKDAVKQRLVVVVEDNGQPSRSATVNVNVAVADSFPEVLSEFSDFTHDKDYNDSLTFYLVLSLAVVSFLFIVSVIVLVSVKVYRWRQSRLFYKSNGNLPVIPSAYYPPRYADVGATGTLQHVYNYEVCMTTDSRKSDFKTLRPCSQSIIHADPIDTQTLQHTQKKNERKCNTDLSEEVSYYL